MELVFLGTGAGNGVPVFYCPCKVCVEAQESSHLRRTRSAIAIVGEKNYLIDAPPELSTQLLREKVRSIDYLFLTHSHHDHCAGLGDLEVYARFSLRGKLPAVMSSETMEKLGRTHGSMEDWLNITLIEPNQTLHFSDISFTGIRVAHSQGTLGYLIEHRNSRIAYIPDTGPLPDESMSLLKGVDNLILDATFNGDNWYTGQHLTILEAIEIAKELAVKKLYLTHLSMHYTLPVTSEEIEQQIRKYEGKVNLAYDGLRMPLGGLFT